jgi:Xaa-Pro aminopeptidase
MLGEIFDLGRTEMKKLGYVTDKAAMPTGGSALGGVTIQGIGLGSMHDPPHVEDRDIRLESGMTLAVAGGVRHSEFTIRFEDAVVVVPGGIEKIKRFIPWEL